MYLMTPTNAANRREPRNLFMLQVSVAMFGRCDVDLSDPVSFSAAGRTNG